MNLGFIAALEALELVTTEQAESLRKVLVDNPTSANYDELLGAVKNRLALDE